MIDNILPFFSCSNIIEEHEEKLEAQQRSAQTAKAGRKPNNNNMSSLLGTDELEFSFGGPALDVGKGCKAKSTN